MSSKNRGRYDEFISVGRVFGLKGKISSAVEGFGGSCDPDSS
jgi:hypothetical protein